MTTLTNIDFQPLSMSAHCLNVESQQLDFHEPSSLEEAVIHPGWKTTMATELQALETTKT